jgi:hypothetical protein
LASGDFSNNLSAPDVLPAGTTQVQADNAVGDLDDFFAIPGLTPGASYRVTFSEPDGFSTLSIYNGLNQIFGR